MYAYIELSNTTRTDSTIQSLSWMNHESNRAETNIENQIHDQRTINPSSQTRNTSLEGWLATGNINHIVSVTYTSMKSDEHISLPDRTNFNLRAHRTDVRLVSWNVPYEKLATVDEKGVIFVWVKHDNRWSLELINDRSQPVTDMCWSHDGRTTVICYEDGFILAGSVTGQRYWSTVLNNLQTKISAVTWLPDMSHVILGTTAGQLIVMDHHGNTTDVFTLSTQSIRQLMYSCNKFYPDAPDTNAKRFVNDEYILACSLENGQILFLNHYQDQSPITVETNLTNVKFDWSSPGEILAVGGFTRLGNDQYANEILFYSRRGEFLHRIEIPQKNEPFTALCWAHGNDIVFAACGSFVYTVWMSYKPLPSLLTKCQMKIKREIYENSSNFLDRYALPLTLRQRLINLYPSIIKGFLPDPKELRSFVCQPLKSHLRLQCTMKRIDQDQENVPTVTSHYSGATYVLYLEYLGGLIPILTAKRISKICPDFIIFDPQNEKISRENVSFGENSIKTSKVRSQTCHELSNIPTVKSSVNGTRSSLIANRNSIYVAETEVQRLRARRKTNVDWSSDENSENEQDEAEDRPMINFKEKRMRKTSKNKSNKEKYVR